MLFIKMNKRLLLLSLIVTVIQIVNAQTKIKIDQFGYLPHATKIAVVSKPVNGFNGGSLFTPGIGKDDYQLRNKIDNKIVFTGTLTAWNSGNIDILSGDKAWWFDFSKFTTPG